MEVFKRNFMHEENDT